MVDCEHATEMQNENEIAKASARVMFDTLMPPWVQYCVRAAVVSS